MRKSSFSAHAARLLLIGCSLTALTSARVARAQPAPAERIQNEVFDDDLLNADLDTPFGARVFGSHLPPVRTQLIHPRTNFLPELYKSVEHL
ncbi:MAG TPA: hypothetical protein VGJ91_23800 [Polyangiaceae bacterium]